MCWVVIELFFDGWGVGETQLIKNKTNVYLVEIYLFYNHKKNAIVISNQLIII